MPLIQAHSSRRRRRWDRPIGPAVLSVLVALIVSCTRAPTPSPTPRPPTSTTEPTTQPSPTTAPSPTAEPVVIVEDLTYLRPLVPDADERQLDVYAPALPAPDDAGYPTVIFAHGYNQSRRALVTVSRGIAAEGAVVMTPSWPTDPTSAASWREMTEALACAVRYARDNGPAYGADPDHVILVGFSMGGALGAQVALAEDGLDALWAEYAAEHEGPPPQVACVSADTPVRVDAFVGIGGAYALADRFEDTDPDLWALLTQLGNNADLVIRLLHGEFDTTVSPEVSQAFADRLSAAGLDVAVVTYDSGHVVPRELTVETVTALAER
ncbi:MAG: alpha/beta hydrolase [Paracoccaceae bacterium]